jgi:hypothetical protein
MVCNTSIMSQVSLPMAIWTALTPTNTASAAKVTKRR